MLTLQSAAPPHAGVRVAETVRRRVKRLAGEAQVLRVTYVAQIACFTDHYFHIAKREEAGRAVTQVRILESRAEREAELARMLSGSEITGEALKHPAGSPTVLDQPSGCTAADRCRE